MKTGHKKKREEEAIKIIGQNVKRLRLERGLTQAQLANICDIEVALVSRVERFVNDSTISTIWLLARHLNVAPSKLLEE